jgi:hypothetical protein
VDVTWLANALGRWGWLLGLVVLFALVYRLGIGSPARGSASTGAGCLAAVVITLLFFLVVIF